MNPQIYLASSSPRRKELLSLIGVNFEQVDARVVEKVKPGETHMNFVTRLAKEKAQAGAELADDRNIPVLGADTIIVSEGNILGKPQDREHAIEMLMTLSGKTHQVITGIALAQHNNILVETCVSDVTFAVLTLQQCQWYWETGEPADKAGGYAIQGKGALFITRLSGSYSGVVGLPIYETSCMLARAGINLMQK